MCSHGWQVRSQKGCRPESCTWLLHMAWSPYNRSAGFQWEPTLGVTWHLLLEAVTKGPPRPEGREHSPTKDTLGSHLWKISSAALLRATRMNSTRMIFQKCKYRHVTTMVFKMPGLTPIQGLTEVTPVFSPTAFLDSF